jgi:glucose-6-phosphate 1-dehydrogenase
VKRAGEQFLGDQRELSLLNAHPDQEQPYERLLGDAMAGDGALFSRADTLEAAWAVVDAILENHPPAFPYPPGSWGPPQADDLIAAHGAWHNPAVEPEVDAPAG